MKIVKNLVSLFVFILAVVCLGGCSHGDKTDVKTVISTELNLLKNLDSDTAQKYVSYKELFPDATKETTLSREIKEVFSSSFRILIIRSLILMSMKIIKKPLQK